MKRVSPGETALGSNPESAAPIGFAVWFWASNSVSLGLTCLMYKVHPREWLSHSSEQADVTKPREAPSNAEHTRAILCHPPRS